MNQTQMNQTHKNQQTVLNLNHQNHHIQNQSIHPRIVDVKGQQLQSYHQ